MSEFLLRLLTLGTLCGADDFADDFGEKSVRAPCALGSPAATIFSTCLSGFRYRFLIFVRLEPILPGLNL